MDFCQRYLDPTKGKLRLPLYAAYRLLQALDAPEGAAYFAREEAFKGLLSARNYSLLAHGLQPVSAGTYDSFKALLSKAFSLDELPTFPML